MTDTEKAALVVRLPATWLMWIGILGNSLLVLSFASVLLFEHPEEYQEKVNSVASELRKKGESTSPELEELLKRKATVEAMRSPATWLVLAAFVSIGLLQISGAQKMKELRNYGWAIASCFLSMIPCVNPCFLIGMPVGVWGLVVLSNPDVRAAFNKSNTGEATPPPLAEPK